MRLSAPLALYSSIIFIYRYRMSFLVIFLSTVLLGLISVFRINKESNSYHKSNRKGNESPLRICNTENDSSNQKNDTNSKNPKSRYCAKILLSSADTL